MRLLLGTTNLGKIVEMRSALELPDYVFVTPDELGITESPEEHGETFQHNAAIKSRFFHARSGLPSISDDSGIIVDALADELGVQTRRWGAGKDASDEEWIAHFLQRMECEQDRRARFVCSVAFTDAGGATHFFEGACNGTITRSLEAEFLPGLPISACFVPDGFDKVYSALDIEQKNSTSHRGRALAALRAFLRTQSSVNS